MGNDNFRKTKGVNAQTPTVGITRKTYEKLRVYCEVNDVSIGKQTDYILSNWLDGAFSVLKQTNGGQRKML